MEEELRMLELEAVVALEVLESKGAVNSMEMAQEEVDMSAEAAGVVWALGKDES